MSATATGAGQVTGVRGKRGRATGPANGDAEEPAPQPSLPNWTSDHQLENAIRHKVRGAFSNVRGRYGVSQETALKAAAASVMAELKMVVDDEVKDIAEPWKPVGRLPGM